MAILEAMRALGRGIFTEQLDVKYVHDLVECIDGLAEGVGDDCGAIDSEHEG